MSARFSLMVTALRHRNFRLFFAGQGVILLGASIRQVALNWLVYRSTHSVLLLGLAAFAGKLPLLIGMPLAGVVADRWDKRRTIMFTQSLGIAQAFTLAALTWTGKINAWELILLNFFFGCLVSIDVPLRQAFTIETLGDRRDLANAISLDSMFATVARIAGALIAGSLLASGRDALCFLLTAISFLALLLAVLAMKNVTRQSSRPPRPVFHELCEGFAYAWRLPSIRNTLWLMIAASLLGMPYVVLLPVFANDILGGGPRLYGLLLATASVGGLLGSFYLASLRKILDSKTRISVAACLFGGSLMVFSQSRSVVLSIIVVAFLGFGLFVAIANSNIVIQTVVDDDKRGRVLGLSTMSVIGMAPLGSILVGALSSRLGAQMTVLLGGAAFFAAAVIFARKTPWPTSEANPSGGVAGTETVEPIGP